MVVGVLRLELFLPAPQNLKEKRAVVRKILGRCRERFPVSCAETGMHDLWQRAELGYSMVGQSEGDCHSVFARIEQEIDRIGLAQVSDHYVEFLHF
ncbi:hypothetical protein DESUT3_18970 [Desulfuromonas versatilis]|uniref:DUF503 domain-containing protein n=1 Tax=Desulfuromonas versatilis TaxID=2802975 RepID=A0ABM8HRB6_9BACT|nr:DUF503 domain-containing protein [Desulfuromonas versatilis]BCR04828.1 hypothetical protein DESUT3_18970 [Desulfuromonas versatilis]